MVFQFYKTKGCPLKQNFTRDRFMSNVHIDYEFFTPQIQMCSDWAIWWITLWLVSVWCLVWILARQLVVLVFRGGIQPLQANSWTIPWWG